MYPKLSSRILLVAALYVLTFLTPILRGVEPEDESRYERRYVLRTFTAAGADSNDYDINDYNMEHHKVMIFIRNVRNKKKVWAQEVGGTGLLEFELRMSPDKKRAVLFFIGAKSQDLYCVHLPEGKPPAKWIDYKELEKLALTVCGKVDSDLVARYPWWFSVDFLDWDAQGRCRLKWKYTIQHEEGDDTTDTGITIITEGRNGEPILSIDSFLKDLTSDQMDKVRYGKHVTLKK